MKHFKWITKDGRTYLPKDMDTTHIFHSIRMIWNHTVESRLRLPGNTYNLKWIDDIDRVRNTLEKLNTELHTRAFREELNEQQLKQYDFMIEHAGTAKFTPRKEIGALDGSEPDNTEFVLQRTEAADTRTTY